MFGLAVCTVNLKDKIEKKIELNEIWIRQTRSIYLVNGENFYILYIFLWCWWWWFSDVDLYCVYCINNMGF